VIASAFDSIQGVHWIRINPGSASLVVRFQQDILSKDRLVGILEQALPVHRRENRARITVKATAHQKNNSQTVSFIGLSLYTTYTILRKHYFKQTVTQGFFGPTGLVVTLFAWPLVKKGLKSIVEKRVSLESFLGGSIIASAVAGESLAALEILWITRASERMQSWVTERSRRAIRDILQVTTKNTYILVDDVEIEIAVEQVQAGDIVVLHTGEKIPVDGEITKGQALVDEAVINGRPEPIPRVSGQRVFAGTFVRQGLICVRSNKVGDDTYLARIVEMVENSLDNKAEVQGVADKLAADLIRLGFVFTAGTLVLTGSLQRAFTVMLVMSCPCATILAASTAISAALSTAARNHILIKGGRYLEAVGRAKTVYFDKTGTLTENMPKIEKIHSYSGLKTDLLLQLAYSAEIHNSHPLAMAIKQEAKKRGLDPITHHVCDFILGKGVRSEIQNSEILIGSKKLLDHFSVSLENIGRHVVQQIRRYEKEGKTVIYLVRDGRLIGIIAFSYRRRSDAGAIIERLRRDGIGQIGLITGDELESARLLSADLGLSPCHFSVMPEEKAKIINEIKKAADGVIMVGDGINDALALAEADIGIVMGAGGSDVAIEAADIALVKDELMGIPFVRQLSRSTLKTVHQNFWIATGSNIVGAALGATGFLSPAMAGLLHIVHTLGVMANSSRLLSIDIAQSSDNTEIRS
jgi:manganese/zinc-transporting P-type ATPase C